MLNDYSRQRRTIGSFLATAGLLVFRLVVLESGLGLESGLESIFAGLGLELNRLGLGSFFSASPLSSPLGTCNLTTNSRNNVRRSEKHELKPESAHILTVTTYITLRYTFTVKFINALML